MRTHHAILFLLTILLIACNRIPEHSKYIPKNALVVASIDMGALQKKLIWNALTGSDLFQEMLKEIKNEDSKKAAKDVSHIGIDANAVAYFYFTGSLTSKSHAAVILKLKDAGALESFILKTYPNATFQKLSQCKQTVIENQFLMAWNQDVLMIFPIKPNIDDNLADAVDGADSAAVIAMKLSQQADFNNMSDLGTYANQAFALSKENAIIQTSSFTQLQKDGHDMSCWINYEELYLSNKDLSSGPAAAFIKEEYFKDAALALGVDFEKGKMEAVMDYHMSDPLAKIYKKYAGASIDKKLVTPIEATTVDMLLTYKLNPNMLKETFEYMKLDGMLNMVLMMGGSSLDKITETFSGDIVFAITDMKEKNINVADSSLANENSNFPIDATYTFVMGLQDNEHALKLLQKGVDNDALVKNGNRYSVPASNNMNLAVEKNYLVASSQSNIIDKFTSGKGSIEKAIPTDVWKHLTENMMGFYINMKKIAEVVQYQVKPTTDAEKKAVDEIKNLLTYAEMYGGQIKKNSSHLEGALYFTNANENSLIQILNVAMKIKHIKTQEDKSPSPIAAEPDTTAIAQ